MIDNQPWKQVLGGLFENDDSDAPIRQAYRAAAAVLVSFDLRTLIPVGFEGPDLEAAASFSDDCELMRDEAGQECWTLKRQVRRDTILSLRSRGALASALAANTAPTASLAQSYLTEALDATIPRPLAGDLPSLRAQLLISDWLTGIAAVPEPEIVRNEVLRLQQLQPFRDLVGEHFAGREGELTKLSDYVGVFDASGLLESIRRGVASVLSLHDRPPLFVYGPGGIGKSTFIARFILDHATKADEVERFPYAYLDFDRTTVDPKEPVTLLIEAMRQISQQYARVSEYGQRLQAEWRERISKQDSIRQSGAKGGLRLHNRDYYIQSFAGFVNQLKTDDLPLLIVLDTFEEVQYRAASYITEVFALLEQLQHLIPRTRCVLSGRDLPLVHLGGRVLDLAPLRLSEFDRAAAIAFLQKRGVQPVETAKLVAEQVGRSPLVLRVAADLWKVEGGRGPIQGLDTGILAWVRRKSLESQLYARILGHIKNKQVQELAHPGLLLRKVTAELILEVLAGPCEIAVTTMADAQVLFGQLQQEFTLVIPDPNSPGAVLHRPDVRSLMLKDLQDDDPDRVRLIHQRAADYYSRKTGDTNWAEELYHRLSLGVDRARLERIELAGLDQLLPMAAIRELPAESQGFLAARLPIEVEDEVWISAAAEDWEGYIRRRFAESQTSSSSGMSSLLAAPPGHIPAATVEKLRNLLKPVARGASGEAIKSLQEGLLQSFSNPDALLSLLPGVLRYTLDLKQPLISLTFELIYKAQAIGLLEELTRAALAQFPRNRLLYAAAQAMGLTSFDEATTVQAQRIRTSDGGLFDLNLWREILGETERQVCLVNIGDSILATGFLVRPRTVMTARHILREEDLENGILPPDLTVRFNQVDIAMQGTLLAADRELDAILISVPGAADLGATDIASETPKEGSVLAILYYGVSKHFRTEVQEQGVVGLDGNGTRLLYRIPTDPGSSGAPCFDEKMRVVAMHQSKGDDGLQSGLSLTSPQFRRFLRRLDKAPEPGPILDTEDTQKGRWGGAPERNGRRLTVEIMKVDGDILYFNAIVDSTDGSDLEGPVVFHLHDSYPRKVIHIRKIRQRGQAILEEVQAYGMYTIGAQVRDRNGEWIGLEFDLMSLPDVPQRFRTK